MKKAALVIGLLLLVIGIMIVAVAGNLQSQTLIGPSASTAQYYKGFIYFRIGATFITIGIVSVVYGIFSKSEMY